MKEVWKPIPTWEKYYKVSNTGKVVSLRTGKEMRPDGRNLKLQAEGRSESYMVPVLMACAFLGLDITDPYRNRVLFKDGNGSNMMLNNIYVEDTSSWPGEEWRPIKEISGKQLKDHYFVSNFGRVKAGRHQQEWMNYGRISTKCCPEVILSQVKDESGYCTCPMTHISGKGMTVQVHRLVATAFCRNPDPEHKVHVNHIDGCPSNNKASNLEWVTPSENVRHALDTGLKTHFQKTLRYPVIREETGVLYNSISDVERAMGRCSGYVSEVMQRHGIIKDADGDIWTLKILKDSYIKVSTEGQHCTIDEFPGKEFISLSEACSAIGRDSGYISEALKRGSKMTTKWGQEIHVHLIGEAPELPILATQKARREQGLIPPPKQRICSKWAPKKAVRHVETGIIYVSMSAADNAMGRRSGYLSECFAYQRKYFDADGNECTFEFVDK